MKLFRVGESGLERPAIQTEENELMDVSHIISDFDGVFFANNGLELLREHKEKGYPGAVKVPAGTRLGPPITTPSKIICAGLNYAAHAQEFAALHPREATLFLKAPSSITGPEDPIIRPPHRYKLDYEVELAVVIGKRALDLDVVDAVDYIAGYTLMCDISERSMQMDHGGQWTKGKSYDTFAPLGPCLVTADEIEDLAALRLWLAVNGEVRQEDYVSSMQWTIPELVSYTSQFMSLMPGDILSTGTPAGVAMGRSDEAYLQPGDLVEMGCDAIGVCHNRVIHS